MVDLLIYRRSAERAHAALTKGDRFVAEGYVRTYEHQVDGQTRHAEEFIAKKLGHDTARTTYTVDRTRRPATVDQTTAADAPTSTPPAARRHRRPATARPSPCDRPRTQRVEHDPLRRHARPRAASRR